MTQYSRACYFAKQAADLARYNGLFIKGFSRLPAPVAGAVWQFCHEESGLVILLNATGAVNSKATKAARMAKIEAAADNAALQEYQAAGNHEAAAILRGRLERKAAANLAPRAPLPAFCLPLAPAKAAPAPLWPVAPRRAFAELAAVVGGR